MKKLLLFLMVLWSGLSTNAKEDWNYKSYFRSDSALVYSWDAVIADWILDSKQIYFYGANGKMDSVIVKSIGTGFNLSKSEYLYNEEGLLTISTNYTWNGIWTLASRDLISYDANSKYSEIVVQTWRDNNWINIRLQKYTTFNLAGAITEFQMFDWGNNDWVYHLTDYWSYDENGRLIKRLALLPDSSAYYQILYKYNENGQRTKMYAQVPSGSNWVNSWLQAYQYSECGMQISQIQYGGIGTDWIPRTKIVFFNSFNSSAFPGKKVPICHKGNTIYVSKNAVKANLAHGDCIGECTVEKKPERHGFDEKEKHENPPFTIYPNPAKEKITIKFDRDECKESKRVELTDFNGKIIRSFNVKDNGDLTIYRGNLISGKYCVKLIGKEVYSAVVIFE